MKNQDKIILDLCGGTGAWSKPYKDAGYDVKVITLPEYDIRNYNPPENVYGILAAPPCTEFAVSGARWWAEKDKNHPELLINALNVVDACIDIIKKYDDLKFWALENPVGRLKRFRADRLGLMPFVMQPFEYGDAYSKKTLIWGDFNKPTKNIVEPIYKIYKDGSKFAPNYGWKSQEERSKTPQGFAKAFFKANQ